MRMMLLVFSLAVNYDDWQISLSSAKVKLELVLCVAEEENEDDDDDDEEVDGEDEVGLDYLVKGDIEVSVTLAHLL